MEPFKNVFNLQRIQAMAKIFLANSPTFDERAFVTAASKNIDALELKQRSMQITEAMRRYLPTDYSLAGKVILASLSETSDKDFAPEAIDTEGIAGWGIMPMVDYVGLYGADHFELSMMLFKEMTQRFSSEFGIRYFLRDNPEKTLNVLQSWIEDDNKHVRRLISEGTRPRLPWGLRLHVFIENPQPVIALLNQLKDDKEEYVRRSVANNLNDIAKDHPDLVAQTIEPWIFHANKQGLKMIKHACRTLVKNGHEKTLSILGYSPAAIKQVSLELTTPSVEFGGDLEFVLTLESGVNEDQPLLIDYAIHHKKANGGLTPKVFKWKVTNLVKQAKLSIKKKHKIKPITTRVYYPGEHKVEVFINGVSVAEHGFELLM
jgi:3-methyladenine DNA glycosylase AlkC